MIDASTLGPWESIYTFVCKDGRNIHIHAPRLRQHCLAMKYPITKVGIDPNLALQFMEENCINPDRVADLINHPSKEPIILCKTEAYKTNDPHTPDTLLVDGHHRYTAAAVRKQFSIRAWLLDLHQWQPFTVVNHGNMTREELIDFPVQPKDWWKLGAK